MSIEIDPSPEQLLALTAVVAETWRSLGETRPHWSVLSGDKFLPENLPAHIDMFHDSGSGDVGQLLAILQHVGRSQGEFESVIDFGCGLGRMTNHLAAHFNSVIGLDISRSHLELARTHSQEVGIKNIVYKELTAPDFGMTQPIDLWFSLIVL